MNLTQARLEPLEYRPASDYFDRIRHLDAPVWLDSGLNSRTTTSAAGRFDILSACPVEQVRFNPDSEFESGTGVLQPLRQALNSLLPVSQIEDIPFSGGLIGYLPYEANHRRHKIPPRQTGNQSLVNMGLYTWAIVLDHVKGNANLVTHPDCRDTCLSLVKECLVGTTPSGTPFRLTESFKASQSAAEYGMQLDRIMEYLKAGDCYQVNLAQHFSAPYAGDCAEAYLQLRSLTPTPHGAYLGFLNQQVMSLSPERFIQIRGNRVETWPIKGTAPRSENPVEDAQLARRLADSEKNRAENLMIVDLMRNDLSQCCIAGSIRVPGLYELHSFPTVHHLVSRVTGQLAENQDAISVLECCFPGGSITGAPKRRAMQIIAELEQRDRGVYCGCIGYLSRCGKADTNIAIRTLEARHGKLQAWGGGGIVMDSDPQSEYQETLDKILPLLRHLEIHFLGQ